MKCLSCDNRFTKSELLWDVDKFGKGYRSSIVNFGDPMPEKETEFAQTQSKQSDVFMVLGSSIVFNPAAGYPRIAKKNGASLIIINKGSTPLDS